MDEKFQGILSRALLLGAALLYGFTVVDCIAHHPETINRTEHLLAYWPVFVISLAALFLALYIEWRSR